MKTKKTEERISTLDFREMDGRYLAERLLRKWKEDFVDEDSGEVVSIERKEVIMDRGTLLQGEKLTEIKFFIDSGDIDEVIVSDIKREASRVIKSIGLWVVVIDLNGKNKTIYLYSDKLETTIEIVTDYIEQTQAGTFSFKSLKTIDYINVLSELDTEIDADEKDINTYTVELEIVEEGDFRSKNKYILKGTDVEDVKRKITKHVTEVKLKQDDIKEIEFDTVILSAKTINCDYIIDADFTREHLPK